MMLEYKAKGDGCTLIRVVSTLYRVCSYCESWHDDAQPLHVREWGRPQCRAHHDPDHNAARNDVEGRASFVAVTRQPNRGTHGGGLAGSLSWGGYFQEFPNSKRERRWESVRTL
ncbi:zinc ribbon domain-containing protein [Geobacillus kaustophilus]|nr:zinc ribbon domain-containing protein [Geobacillus kaustophilus]